MLDSNTANLISNIIGWTYFSAWSISFYPQVIMNWRRKSCKGLSQDFVVLNCLGFLCYLTYTAAFYWSEDIRRQYRERNDGKDNLVALNDFVFACHAFVLTVIVYLQSLIYTDSGVDGNSGRTSLPIRFITVFFAMLMILPVAACLINMLSWIDWLYLLSLIKLSTTLIKYFPQAYMNYKRKSTVGWAISNILLDFTGGVLSIAQIVFDGWYTDNWEGITGNWIKVGLGFFSLSFDILFIIQHYILYRNHHDTFNYREIMPDGDEEIAIDDSSLGISASGQRTNQKTLNEFYTMYSEEQEENLRFTGRGSSK